MKYRTAYPNELYHHGVLGMKWGVRRYQNYDGTRIGTGGAPVIKPSSLKGGVQRVGTGEVQRNSMPKALKKSVAGGQGGKAEGNARLAAKAPNPLFERTVKQGKGKDDITPAEKIAKETRNASESSKKLVEAAERHDPKLKEKKAAAERSQAQKAKKMSDKELRDNINRIKMEREYVSLTTKETSNGYDKAKEVLSVVGDVAGVVLALVSIYATIRSVKKLKQSGIDDSDEEALIHSMLEDGDYDDEFISHAIALDDEYVADYIDDFLEHHGIKGQKWGVRRFQNYDGTRIGTGSGIGGGGGGSKASKPFRDKSNSVASKSPFNKENMQKRKVLKEIKNDKTLTDLQKETVSALIEGKEDPHTIIKNALKKTDVSSILKAKKEFQEISNKVDWDKVTKDEIEYDLKFVNKAVDEIKIKHPDIYESIVNDCKKENFDIIDHKVVNNYAFNMDDYDPQNRPNKSKEEKASDKAGDIYIDKLNKGFETIVGSEPYSKRTNGLANLDSYWDYYNSVILELEQEQKRR